MDADKRELLEHAITHREQVTATYNNRVRSFCPHVLGTKGGEQHVLVYQFSGEGESGVPLNAGWRCLVVDKLSDMSSAPGEWHSAANIYNPQSCLDVIEVAVQPFPPHVRVPDPQVADDLSP
jgi:hypothetical protein